MNLDKTTGKLFAVYLAVNLLSAFLALITASLIGVYEALIVFTAAVIVLPLIIQYIVLSSKLKQDNHE